MRPHRRRGVPLALLGTLAVSAVASACAGLRTPHPIPDGTEDRPFDAREVDVAPRVIGCEAGLLWSRSGVQTRSANGGGFVNLVVDADGRVVPGSVGQKRRGMPLPPPAGAGTERDVLTCRYEPGMRHGQPVAVRTTTFFTYP